MPDKKPPVSVNIDEGFVGRVKDIVHPDLFNIPKNAASTLSVEGLPSDATEREVAHIFRPF